MCKNIKTDKLYMLSLPFMFLTEKLLFPNLLPCKYFLTRVEIHSNKGVNDFFIDKIINWDAFHLYLRKV